MFCALQLEGCGFQSTSKPPRRDPGQVLHSQLLMRFGVKLRLSVRAVVGSASEWESGRGAITSVQIQYNTIQYSDPSWQPLRLLSVSMTTGLEIIILDLCRNPLIRRSARE